MGQKYPGVSVSGYLSAPPSDDGSITDANKVKFSTHVTKIGNPLYNAITDLNTALVTAFDQAALLKTANFTTTLAENFKLLEVTGSNTISLLDASTGGAGYQINVVNTGVGTVVVSRATAGNTINGVAGNWTLNPGNGASFRVNSTLNGYHVIGTALSTGAGLADVMHLTGTETVTGAKTFTSNIWIYKASARLDLQDTAQVLPAGLWGWQCADNKLYLFRNTHASGGFGSLTIPVQFDNADKATFLGTVTAAAATVSTELVTKAQLDAKVYGGQVSSAGTAVYLPSGWSSARNSIGNFTITHNLGTTNYAPVPISHNGPSVVASTSALGANSFVVLTHTSNIATLVDVAFNFTVARN